MLKHTNKADCERQDGIMKKYTNLKKQSGFGVAAILGVIFLLSMLGVVITTSINDSGKRYDKVETKYLAQVIMKQSSEIKYGMLSLAENDPRITSVKHITLDRAPMNYPGSPATVGLYNIDDGSIDSIFAPKNALTNPGAMWQASNATVFWGSPSTNISISDVKADICKAINDEHMIPQGERTIGSGLQTTLCDEATLTYISVVEFD